MKRKIITVDDSESIRKMIVFSLKKGDYDVSEASDGAEALEKLKEAPADLLITDLDMPKMNGIQLIRNVRSIPHCRNMPVLIITTENDRGIKEKAKSAGASAWITKPFTPGQLNGAVRKVLGEQPCVSGGR